MYNLTQDQIAEINEFPEAAAHISSFLSAPPEFTKPFRLEAKRIGSVWATMIPELDFPEFNRILGLGIGEPATETMLDDAIAIFKEAGCRNYLIEVSPLAQPTQIPEWLVARGFKPRRNWVRLYRQVGPAPSISTDFQVVTIGKEQADAFADVVLPVFGLPAALRPLMTGSVGKPGWCHVVAYDQERPVSAASMFINGEVGWLSWAGTLKKYRNRGGQRAIGARLAEEGLMLGCKWLAAETREETSGNINPSLHNMLKYGFQQAYLQQGFIYRSPASPARKIRRAFFIIAYSIKFSRQRG